eukprot:scaffold2708_cov158-Ochromonas_danica.AAC.27
MNGIERCCESSIFGYDSITFLIGVLSALSSDRMEHGDVILHALQLTHKGLVEHAIFAPAKQLVFFINHRIGPSPGRPR